MTYKKNAITTLALIMGMGVATQMHAHFQDQTEAPSSYSRSNYESTTTTSRTDIMSDSDLSSRIQDKIDTASGFDNVNVRVNNGIVTLQGSVRTQDDKFQLERDIRSMNGVRSINNQITVQEGLRGTIQDQYRATPSRTTYSDYDSRSSGSAYDSQVDRSYGGQSSYNPSDRTYSGQSSYNPSDRTYSGQSSYNPSDRSMQGDRSYNIQRDRSFSSYNQGERPAAYGSSSTTYTRESSMQSAPNDFPNDRGATPSDKLLNQKIRDRVSRGWFVNSYKQVVLNTNNGYVTLEGAVEKTDDQKKLIAEIQRIEGVNGVRSNLKIKNP